MPVVNKVKKINTKAKAVKKEKKGVKPAEIKAENIGSVLEVAVYDSSAKEVSKINLNPEIFGLKVNAELVAQALEAQMSQARVPYAHTKTRGEVRGGGKKPWRQKGTGRARHGSNRSPIWRGGGTVFGPRKERIFAKDINKKMKRKALLMILSGKCKDNEIIVLENLNLEQPKTKLMVGLIENFKAVKNDIKKGGLIVMAGKNENVIRASRNIAEFATIGAQNLNAVDLLKYKYLVMPKEAVAAIEKTFLNK
ncbi:MAG: 50S ribosomal protein L4 [Candidatus Portnoybacteria bacterium]|nr:50S ribosomal protein L4 [Candidatus Portnoybacteria bacterium]